MHTVSTTAAYFFLYIQHNLARKRVFWAEKHQDTVNITQLGQFPRCSHDFSVFDFSEVKLWMGDPGGPTSQLTSSCFEREVELGVPCLDAACTVGLN